MNRILSDSTLQAIFDTEIAPILDSEIAGRTKIEQPVLFMVGAQPGAGKTKAIASIASRNNAIEINGDDLRTHHPDYDQLMDADPLLMPSATSQASGAWVSMSLDYLRHRRVSTIIETTFNHPDSNAKTLRDFHQVGFQTRLIALVVPPILSLAGIVMRYIRQVETNGSGRWTDPAYHDKAMQQIPQTLRLLLKTGNVDMASIANRDGDIIETVHAGTAGVDDQPIEKLLNTFANSANIDTITSGQKQIFNNSLAGIQTFLESHPDESALIQPVFERLQHITGKPSKEPKNTF
ncbi:zeta toxin family protein [Bifidobacterium sp. ESL0769]|uniref:zeta toxin family protein n=1 Tax=Bifidobacterium sp. ESL0769 TaxID=2983229 RepID=UPI0023F7AABC|nr:zeta toxin family protein [Bifidobacterium sp. ESL0769]WEV67581.1 zeta toxin family protein [Bifidobacterium sp. ESL0769]